MASRFKFIFSILLLFGYCFHITAKQSFFKRIFSRNKTEIIPEVTVTELKNSVAVSEPKISEEKLIDHTIRVLLIETQDESSWQLSASQGFVITDGFTHKKKRTPQTVIELGYKDSTLMLNGRRIKETYLKIDAQKGLTISFNGKEYQGSLIVMIIENKCLIINQLNFEDYIYCVLRSESWPGWPVEVNKAFAIASRSYAMVKYLENIKKKKPYHIKNSNVHQTYNGFHTNANLKKAVDETSGVILTHNKKPIIAMFDCCCGDIIPAHLTTIDLEKAPYLARKVPCTFCKSSKIYQWQLEFEVQELKDILNNSGFNITAIHDMYVSKKDKAGAVEEITVKDHGTHHYITGKQLYAMLSKVKSFCYSIRKRGKKITLAGKGYGHHLGMCQWGARNMINYGWNYQSILQFYYPGTTFMRLAYA